LRTDPRQLHRQPFDVLVVGGGIHGAAVAREAALRGARTLLVERDDFACGTSMRSSRLVHGGVRYLQQGHLGLVREALRERERLLRALPHLVRPLPMLMPKFVDGPGRLWVTRFGLWLYRRLAGRTTLPPARAYGPAECLRLFPGLRARGLRGGVVFFDAVTEDLPLVLAVLEAARRAGAILCNHLEAHAVRGDGVVLQDTLAGAELTVRARHVVNAAGPGADALRRRLGIDAPDLVRTTRGGHVVFAPRDGETALAAFLPDRRIQFVIPHRDGTVCGTTDVDDAWHEGDANPAADVAYLLEALGFLLDAPPPRESVRFAYAGWRSLPARRGPAGALNREAFVVAEPCAAGTLHTIVGGKLTTHRSLAERFVADLLGVTEPSPSRAAPLPGGDGPQEPGDPLWQRHGSRAQELRELARAEPGWLEPFCPHRDWRPAEAVFAVREQGARTLTDLALRRLFHTQGPCLAEDCLRRLHALLARELPDAAPAGQAIADLRAAVARLTGGVVAS
jgi:glycerol-3-phosphate dehydrogenase